MLRGIERVDLIDEQVLRGEKDSGGKSPHSMSQKPRDGDAIRHVPELAVPLIGRTAFAASGAGDTWSVAIGSPGSGLERSGPSTTASRGIRSMGPIRICWQCAIWPVVISLPGPGCGRSVRKRRKRSSPS